MGGTFIIIDLARYGKVMYQHNRLSRDEILLNSEIKFRKVLKHAYKNSSFYNNLYSEQGIEYGDLDTIPISSLPVIDKKSIRDNFFSIPACRLSEHDVNKALSSGSLLPRIGDKYIVHTSGSTGTPTNFIYDKRALMILEANFVRLTVQGGDRAVGLHDFPIKSLYIAPVGSGYACTALAVFGMDEYKCKSVIINAQKPLDEWTALIGGYKPSYLSGYPSCISMVAKLKEYEKININPKKIITGGEPLTKEASEYFHNVFGADVIDYYGCTESIFIGAGSSYYDGIYFYDDLNYTEVDDSNRLIITPLYNRAFPLIRYRLTDIMDGFTKKGYGSLPYTHINKVLGREEELMWFTNCDGHKDFLHPLFLDDLNIKDIMRYQFIQKSPVYFELKCISSNKNNEELQKEEINKQLSQFLKAKKLENIKYGIAFVDSLQKNQHTGKIKMVIKEF